jgi:hypothetical protein
MGFINQVAARRDRHREGCVRQELGISMFCITAHRLSRTKKCNTTKLEAVNVTKKMPRSDMFGHQNDCARRPNVDRIVAAGTSSSTPYCVTKWVKFVRHKEIKDN